MFEDLGFSVWGFFGYRIARVTRVPVTKGVAPNSCVFFFKRPFFALGMFRSLLLVSARSVV